jgi:hypothetical protein
VRRTVAGLALLLVACLSLATVASGATLKRSRARSVTKAVALRAADRLDTAQLDDVTTAEVRRTTVAKRCRRHGKLRVDCTLHLRGVVHDPDLGDLPFNCRARERVRYRSRHSRRIRRRADHRHCAGDLADVRKDLEAAFKRALR